MLFKRLDPEQMSFMQKIPGSLMYEPTNMSIDEVIDYLIFCREILNAGVDLRADSQLNEEIAITAKLS